MTTPVLEQIKQLAEELTPDERAELVAYLQERETEAEWETQVLQQALGDALRPDGSVDLDALYAKQSGASAQTLFPQYFDADGHILPEEAWAEESDNA